MGQPKISKDSKVGYYIAIAVFVVLLIAIGIVRRSWGSNQPATNNSTLKPSIAVFQLYVAAPFVAAIDSQSIGDSRDIFKDVGLEPTILKQAKGPDIVNSLQSGSADFGTLAITPIALQAAQGNEFRIFATIQTTSSDIKVLCNASKGITDASKLSGHVVGYVGGTFGEIFLDRYLAKHKLTRSDVNLVAAAPAQLRDGFLAGSLDAVVIWEPFAQDIKQSPSIKEGQLFVDVDESLYTGTINLVAKASTLETKREEAQRLVKALLVAEEVLKAHPDQVQAKLEAWLERKPGSLNGVFVPRTFHVELNQAFLKKGLGDEIDWAAASVFKGKKLNPVSPEKLIDPSIMSVVAPDRLLP